MAFSLLGERSLSAASSDHPLAAIKHWIAKINAARTRRVALQALLELDHARLYDLGISRQDITTALASKNGDAVLNLNTARAHNARR